MFVGDEHMLTKIECSDFEKNLIILLTFIIKQTIIKVKSKKA